MELTISSMRARTKLLASFEAGMNSPKLAVTRKHYVIERQKRIRGIFLLSLKHLSNHGLKVDFNVSFFRRSPFPFDLRVIFSLSINLFKFPCPCLIFGITLRCHFVKKVT